MVTSFAGEVLDDSQVLLGEAARRMVLAILAFVAAFDNDVVLVKLVIVV